MSTPIVNILDIGRGLFQVTSSLVSNTVLGRDVLGGPGALRSVSINASVTGFLKFFDMIELTPVVASPTELFGFVSGDRSYELYPASKYLQGITVLVSVEPGSVHTTAPSPLPDISFIVEKL